VCLLIAAEAYGLNGSCVLPSLLLLAFLLAQAVVGHDRCVVSRDGTSTDARDTRGRRTTVGADLSALLLEHPGVLGSATL
jgi:hypothetical protein